MKPRASRFGRRSLAAVAVAGVVTAIAAATASTAAAGPQVVRDAAGIEWRIVSAEGEEPGALVERLGADRQRDPRFGSGGRIAASIGSDGDLPSTLRVEPSGRLWVGGTSEDSGSPEPVVLRFLADGRPDPAWGAGGRLAVAPSANASWLHDLLPRPDGSVIVAGDTENPNGEERASVWKLNPDGTVDAAFAPGGLWVRPGNEGARAAALATADERVIGLAVVVMEGAEPWAEVYDDRAGPGRFALAQREKLLPDRGGEYRLAWESGRWRISAGRETPVLAVAAQLTVAEAAPAAPPATPPEPAGHAGLSPFATDHDRTASVAPPPEEDAFPLFWAAAVGALVLAAGGLWLMRRGSAGR